MRRFEAPEKKGYGASIAKKVVQLFNECGSLGSGLRSLCFTRNTRNVQCCSAFALLSRISATRAHARGYRQQLILDSSSTACRSGCANSPSCCIIFRKQALQTLQALQALDPLEP